MSLFDYTLKELQEKLHNKEITVTDLVDASYARIKEVDDEVKAFLTLDEENARAAAKELDEQGGDNPLFGIPIGIKDNIVTKGLRTTCASKFLDNFTDPLYDATVVSKLKDKKTVTIGKLNMDEFAMGSSNENSAYFTTRNPWNTDYVPGGSSGASAAAVAAGEVFFSLGSDTGGSIREPAAFCGVVGLKPTYGLVSRFGLVAFASSLDQIGPMTRTVEDNAHLLQAIVGHDEMDSTSADVEIPNYTEALKQDVKGLRIAVPSEYLGEGVSDEVRESIKAALKVYEDLGATWEEVSLPHSRYAVAAYYLLSSSEASANLARFDGVRYGVRSTQAENMVDVFKYSRRDGFGEEVKRRIMLGTFALSSGYYDAYYKKAQKARTLIKNDFDKVFEDYDVIVGPTTPTPAFKVGEKVEDPLTMYATDILTIPVNLAGVPGISLPCGFSSEGLPIGLQIIGKHFDEATIYRAAHAFEQATDHHKQKPALGGVKG
ncbi:MULTISPECIES: Asp-tRNA(Asn)/Glu-tRNA(Gln) amidotransferase subunit GatA [Terribacillus]|jgi:aspartyl-tRNA(Asn)/glutamyl-tRNA(Gln) amidotransferase subunit A|uniref:Glutamyl-tRNA(Gln) amidotransferase subunit A n=1 Tax=Terribacillus saccharophilus TaxID=361277 RepID=A0A268HBV9_9BACI|nr:MULTISPECIES: Asp-tRNA(Asn)/Glu-tRNA(Gln) amidotransferase subunit GatA [Terribacillus]MEC0302488.1 Asp-tRNA(Asn)/Glu-tRNA(Gln) amidotransferase subunit GatA [Terribacillus saccharophilus]PAD35709.1 Asp-tRNA(Asn)/Glu-tRNA(Gln) amidotransferase GatCAB subunit A [Terribacillus saccharophilus]PAD96569.1 Asp-tRNA(Asn)/Glu-tRNA(Gln) amidotransferase GatCAB subunit A [Terribacillus saccharophilus]PAE00145.1 Asp-tRNA(Asn)/Glu-tRNA(Gln) amidotransferase GatCAB subunit A [Terribacillus saccharophilus